LASLWYLLDNCSLRTIGKLFQVNHTLIYRWIHEFTNNLPAEVSCNMQQTTFDELWRFVDLKKENLEALKQLVIKNEKLLPNFLANAILQRFDDSILKI